MTDDSVTTDFSRIMESAAYLNVAAVELLVAAESDDAAADQELQFAVACMDMSVALVNAGCPVQAKIVDGDAELELNELQALWRKLLREG